jgi:protein tyrosine/serine phosphatase
MNITSLRNASLVSFALLLLGGCGYGPLMNKGYVGPDKQVVRMAQPTEGDLEKVLEEDDITGIVCLRGDQTGEEKEWFDTEVAFAEEHDLDFYTVRLSTGRLPTREQLGDLIEIFKTADYPLLVHCQAGADRTGFAAVVYRLVVLDEPLDDALDSFSIWRGHVKRNTPLDQLFEFYREEADGRRFEKWFRQDYDVERLNKKLDPPPED